MGLSEFLSALFFDADDGPSPPSDGDGVVHECRTCGTTVSEGTDRCPSCDSTAIAEYRIE